MCVLVIDKWTLSLALLVYWLELGIFPRTSSVIQKTIAIWHLQNHQQSLSAVASKDKHCNIQQVKDRVRTWCWPPVNTPNKTYIHLPPTCLTRPPDSQAVQPACCPATGPLRWVWERRKTPCRQVWRPCLSDWCSRTALLWRLCCWGWDAHYRRWGARTHVHTHARAHAHAHTHSYGHTHAHSLTHKHTHTHKFLSMIFIPILLLASYFQTD